MTDWYRVSYNMSENSGMMKAIIEGLLREDCSKESKEWYAKKYQEVLAKDIYEGADK